MDCLKISTFDLAINISLGVMRGISYSFALAVHLVAMTSRDACGEYENGALGKPTDQSSTYQSFVASNAVDGVRNTVFETYPCTHTRREDNPWWTVDLLNTYTIGYIRITNRLGWCSNTPKRSCNERLARFRVHVSSSVGDLTDQTLCYASNDTSPPLEVNVTCESSLSGRHVNLSLPREDVLTLCEVEVYGELLNESFNEASSTLIYTGQGHATHQDQLSTSSFTASWEIRPTPLTSDLGITQDHLVDRGSALGGSRSFTGFSTIVLGQILDSSQIATRTLHSTDASPETTAFLPVQSSLYTLSDFSEGVSTTNHISHITTFFSNSSVDRVSVEQSCCHCPQNACRRKYLKGLNRDESARFMSSVLHLLDLNLTEVINQRMRYICLTDDRKSATSIGAFAMVLIVTVFSSLLVSDITKIINEMKRPKV